MSTTAPSTLSPGSDPTATAPTVRPDFPLSSDVAATLQVGSGNAGIVFTAATAGSAGNAIRVYAAIDPQEDGVTSAQYANGQLSLFLSGEAGMQVTGTLTSDGSTPVTFAAFRQTGEVGGKPSYQAGSDELYWETDKWILRSLVGVEPEWHSSEDVATPDLVTTWTAQGSATGTPTLTALSSIAQQVVDAIEDAGITAVTATLAGDGTGTFPEVSPARYLDGGFDGQAAASAPSTLSPGSDATATAPEKIEPWA